MLASLRNPSIGLMRIEGNTKVKETVEWMAEKWDWSVYFMAT